VELLAFMLALGTLAALAVRFGADSRPGFHSADHRPADLGQLGPDEELDCRLAQDLRAAGRRSPAVAPVLDVRCDAAHFAAVGLRIETARARAFAAALCHAASEERAGGDGGWPGRAVDRVVRSVSVEQLASVIEDMGLGGFALAHDAVDDAGADALRALMIHLLRDQLQDALRLSAGLRPFWPWDAPVAAGEPAALAPAGEATASLVGRAA
jgi:hypothetical protein